MNEIEKPNLEPAELWRKFLSGDDESFDLLYTQFVQILFYYGLQFTSDRELLKDCIQDTFVKIYDSRFHLHHVSNIGLYLRITTKNLLINSLGREKKYSKSTDLPEISSDEDNMAEPYIIQKEEELQKQNKIDSMMDLLTPNQRKVVRYRFVEGLSLEQISSLMGVNYQSTQNTLQRAIKKIKRQYFPKK